MPSIHTIFRYEFKSALIKNTLKYPLVMLIYYAKDE